MTVPRFWGQPWSAGALLLFFRCVRPLRTSWLIVGIASPVVLLLVLKFLVDLFGRHRRKAPIAGATLANRKLILESNHGVAADARTCEHTSSVLLAEKFGHDELPIVGALQPRESHSRLSSSWA